MKWCEVTRHILILELCGLHAEGCVCMHRRHGSSAQCFFTFSWGLFPLASCMQYMEFLNPRDVRYGATTFSWCAARAKTVLRPSTPYLFRCGVARRGDVVQRAWRNTVVRVPCWLLSPRRRKLRRLPLRTRVSFPAAAAFSLVVRRQRVRRLLAQRPWCAG